MKKGKKVTRTYRWAVVDAEGNVVRSMISHRPAVYASKATANAHDDYYSTPRGVRVKRILVEV